MLKVEWKKWLWTYEPTKEITEIIESYKTTNSEDVTILCGFNFGPSGGYCTIGDGLKDVLIQDLIGKENMKEMIERILESIRNMERNYGTPSKMFGNTSMKDVKISTVPCQHSYQSNIWIDLKYS